MKKFIILLLLPVFLFSNAFAVEINSEIEKSKNEEQIVLQKDFSKTNDNFQKNKKSIFKKKKDSRIKKFFKKLNPFKNADDDLPNYIISFILGLLLGIIGILIAFLIYMNNPNRKQIMRFAWIGWLMWLVIFSIILL